MDQQQQISAMAQARANTLLSRILASDSRFDGSLPQSGTFSTPQQQGLSSKKSLQLWHRLASRLKTAKLPEMDAAQAERAFRAREYISTLVELLRESSHAIKEGAARLPPPLPPRTPRAKLYDAGIIAQMQRVVATQIESRDNELVDEVALLHEEYKLQPSKSDPKCVFVVKQIALLNAEMANEIQLLRHCPQIN